MKVRVKVKVRSVERIVVIVIIMKQVIFDVIVMMTIIMITVMKVKKVRSVERSVERNVERFAVGIVMTIMIESSDEIDIMVIVAIVLLSKRNKEAVIMILSKHISRIQENFLVLTGHFRIRRCDTPVSCDSDNAIVLMMIILE